MITGWTARWCARAGLAALALAVSWGGTSGQQSSSVRAVLFYSPTCPHCHEVMTVALPPLVAEFGDRLQILTVSTATGTGQRLYLETVRELAIPDERTGVPTLLVGKTVLVGSAEIPDRFPRIVREALAGGGIDWPDVPAIRSLLQAQGLLEPRPAEDALAAEGGGVGAVDTAAATPRRATEPSAAPAPAPVHETNPGDRPMAGTGSGSSSQITPDTLAQRVPTASTSATERPTPMPGIGVLGTVSGPDRGMRARFNTDPVGNGTAVAVLLLMLLAVAAVMAAVNGRVSWSAGPDWVVPFLGLSGLGVALYLAFVEMTGAAAVCGPVGDCNTVQQSPYARIGGVIPVGLLGAAGYLLMLLGWYLARRGPSRHRSLACLLLWGATVLGTLFSIYLTFLEPFVIGATCLWCLTSAVIMTVLLLQVTPRALAQPAQCA